MRGCLGPIGFHLVLTASLTTFNFLFDFEPSATLPSLVRVRSATFTSGGRLLEGPLSAALLLRLTFASLAEGLQGFCLTRSRESSRNHSNEAVLLSTTQLASIA